MSEKVLYREEYKAPHATLKKDSLPVLNHLNDGFECVAARLMSAGAVMKDGERMEFIDMRVFIRETA